MAVLEGIVGIAKDSVYVVTRGDYVYEFNVTSWGWIHLVIGLALIATGIGLFSRAVWAGVIALFLVVLSAIDNFFFIPYYPFWSILIIALNIWVIWSLTRPGVIGD